MKVMNMKRANRKGWREYLEDGDLVFTPHDLHMALLQIMNIDEMKPRGEMLIPYIL